MCALTRRAASSDEMLGSTFLHPTDAHLGQRSAFENKTIALYFIGEDGSDPELAAIMLEVYAKFKDQLEVIFVSQAETQEDFGRRTSAHEVAFDPVLRRRAARSALQAL